ncbi:hypothetical protein T4D_7825 [Trichinella pseudospiralis]|uniref:aralkylamine N-acetyltransferase n=1 Tax=Trichinella pseudospiralis TaxID=6337 RepID=A0A0V1FAW5_TRIPS|nr:hypothetical protein T4D_7825 [Trichinella pseudospiralis]
MAEIYQAGQKNFIGESSSFSFEDAKIEHSAELYDLLCQGFLHDEPLNRASAIGLQDAEPFFKNYIQKCLNSNLSVVVRDCLTGRLVGCALNDVGYFETEYQHESQEGYSEKMATVNLFVEQVKSSMDGHFPTGSKYAELCLLSVHPSYYRGGLGYKLCLASLDRAKQCGCQYVITVATSLYTQKICRKLNFSLIQSFDYANYRKGDQFVFRCKNNTAEDQQYHSVQLLYLSLRS